MVDVFINFKRRDRKHAERMEACLIQAGHTVYCEAMPQFGSGLNADLKARLRDARLILTIWSSASIRSRAVLAAASIGEDMRKMVPVRIDTSTPPAPFNVIHIAELSKWQGDPLDPIWDAVLRRITRVLDGPSGAAAASSEPRRSLPRAQRHVNRASTTPKISLRPPPTRSPEKPLSGVDPDAARTVLGRPKKNASPPPAAQEPEPRLAEEPRLPEDDGRSVEAFPDAHGADDMRDLYESTGIDRTQAFDDGHGFDGGQDRGVVHTPDVDDVPDRIDPLDGVETDTGDVPDEFETGRRDPAPFSHEIPRFLGREADGSGEPDFDPDPDPEHDTLFASEAPAEVRKRRRSISQRIVNGILDMPLILKALTVLVLFGMGGGLYFLTTLKIPYKDCPECPEMIALEGGSVIVGSPLTEPGRESDESPQIVVNLKPFSVSIHEVTFEQWDACIDDGGCRGYRPDDEGWGRGDRPVINVSWHDAQAYVTWLRRRTGKAYRLLTETEWEYAARADTQTPYSVGETITDEHANFNDALTQEIGADLVGKRTAATGAFPANTFGLYDMHGNVWEWVEDCYHDSYRQTPKDGDAYVEEPCKSRVHRGGAWNFDGPHLRSASRAHSPAGDRSNAVGFRVARDM